MSSKNKSASPVIRQVRQLHDWRWRRRFQNDLASNYSKENEWKTESGLIWSVLKPVSRITYFEGCHLCSRALSLQCSYREDVRKQLFLAQILDSAYARLVVALLPSTLIPANDQSNDAVEQVWVQEYRVWSSPSLFKAFEKSTPIVQESLFVSISVKLTSLAKIVPRLVVLETEWKSRRLVAQTTMSSKENSSTCNLSERFFLTLVNSGLRVGLGSFFLQKIKNKPISYMHFLH